MMTDTKALMLGVLVAGCCVSSLFFLRFWRKTHDRLFAIFATSFLLLGLNWLLLALTPRDEPHDAFLYLIRLAAFVLILVGIADKNRARP